MIIRRTRAHARPLFTFGLVGVVNTAVTYACYLLLHLVMPYLAAFLLSWVAGIITSFFLNCRFTYHVAPTLRRFLAYPLSVLPNVVLSTLGVVLMVEVLRWNERLAPLVATVLAVPVSYLLARFILLGDGMGSAAEASKESDLYRPTA